MINNRIGKIGASQISGIIRHYCMKAGIIESMHERQELSEEEKKYFDGIIDNMGAIISPHNNQPTGNYYLWTPWSIAHYLSFNEQQLQDYHNFESKNAIERMSAGNKLENLLMEYFLEKNPDYELLSDFNQKQEICNIQGVDVIATIDFIVQHKETKEKVILETKSTINDKYEIEDVEIPTQYYPQVQMQMHLHNIKKAFIFRAYYKKVNVGTEENPIFEYVKTDKCKQELYEYNPKFIRILKYALSFFDSDRLFGDLEYQENQKEDKKMQSFLEKQSLTAKVSDQIIENSQSKDFVLNQQTAAELEELINQYNTLSDIHKTNEKTLETLKINIDAALNSLYKQGNKYIKFSNIEVKISETSPSKYNEKTIAEAIAKAEEKLLFAKNLKVGDLKSQPRFTWKIEYN